MELKKMVCRLGIFQESDGFAENLPVGKSEEDEEICTG